MKLKTNDRANVDDKLILRYWAGIDPGTGNKPDPIVIGRGGWAGDELFGNCQREPCFANATGTNDGNHRVALFDQDLL